MQKHKLEAQPMNPEFKKLAERRAEEFAPTEEGIDTSGDPGWWTNDMRHAHISGALDPVLEEARRAMYRAELWIEAASRVEVRSDGRVHDVCVDFRELAQAEREKLKKILAP